ncbi:FAD/NAD(P)-binding domain-containing protein [Kitasatospora sp. MAP5-34]|uniref:FAD/NAD(P)-binding protein n=1 Tax=Kitasatospora sp. MAP5-34 TaxID=3035102 RepID=UPI00247718AE|nr:FAD/NAD(P)-binding domain-containing protein [Kitasatospora sp. MAP5-34]MDH6579945.1 putative NAD(P)/FAD-binding protein YdhS [Kitasatospora sp. MAP5-34]
MTALQVSIVGVGPRGLSILQRISELADRLPEGCGLDLHLIDPGDGGQGTHSARQPGHLLTNTVASQVTMFADGRGPSFTEWAADSGYREFGAEFYPTGGDAGQPVGEHAYLPRQLLGRYLSWVFDRTVRSLPPRVRVVHHRDRAVDIEAREDGRFVVHLAKGFVLPSDYVFLATGHCERLPTEEDRAYDEFARTNTDRNPRLGYCPTPYPVDRLQEIAPGSSVAVQGFGLTAHDVVSELTVGRGGRFHGSGPDMEYRPSGREPRIRLFSRQCLPFSARGVNQKGLTGQHRARFFTKEAVRRLKEQAVDRRNDPRLDFEEEVLPLLLREMGYAYRTAREQRPIPPEEYDLTPAERRAIEAVIDPLSGREFANQDAFTRFFVDYVVSDLEHAEIGNATSPVKAATDVIRDTRAGLREAVEFSRLTPESHRKFNATYVPMMNRVSFGPPRHRNHQLLALLRAGVVDLAGGPGCRVVLDREAARFAIRTDYPDGPQTCHADVLVIARLDSLHPERDKSPLIGNLLARGLVRPYANGPFKPGGIDIDERGRPITAAGEPLRTAWAVGYLVEGPQFYTHALPRQGMASQFTLDAETTVRDMIAHIRRRYDVTREEEHAGADRKPVSVP